VPIVVRDTDVYHETRSKEAGYCDSEGREDLQTGRLIKVPFSAAKFVGESKLRTSSVIHHIRLIKYVATILFPGEQRAKPIDKQRTRRNIPAPDERGCPEGLHC
jgi:hypothetical protein